MSWIKTLQRLLKKVSIMKFWGKTILGNYGKKAKPVRITVTSMKSSLKKERQGIWYSKWFQGRGGQKICHKVRNAITPQFNMRFLVGFLKELLKQNPSYQISKHHPNLCQKGCSSSFPRQIKIRQLCDYNVIQHSQNAKMSSFLSVNTEG